VHSLHRRGTQHSDIGLRLHSELATLCRSIYQPGALVACVHGMHMTTSATQRGVASRHVHTIERTDRATERLRWRDSLHQRVHAISSLTLTGRWRLLSVRLPSPNGSQAVTTPKCQVPNGDKCPPANCSRSLMAKSLSINGMSYEGIGDIKMRPSLSISIKFYNDEQRKKIRFDVA